MRPVAYLTSANMLADHPNVREDDWEHAWEVDALRPACAQEGFDLQVVVWDDPALDPAAYDAIVVGTTWDYTDHPARFLRTLEAFSKQTRLFNPLSLLRWNVQKTYLRDLADRGAPIVRTLWRDQADPATIEAAFDDLGVDEIVVKPQVGAAAWRQVRLRQGEPLPDASELPPAETLIQPYLSSVAAEGEYSFLFFDRVYSHCARKVPKDGDYRVQSIFGATEHAVAPSEEDLALARRVVDLVEGPLLYARVDMVRDRSGALALMELELIEPYFYPAQGPAMGACFAKALSRLA